MIVQLSTYMTSACIWSEDDDVEDGGAARNAVDTCEGDSLSGGAGGAIGDGGVGGDADGGTGSSLLLLRLGAGTSFGAASMTVGGRPITAWYFSGGGGVGGAFGVNCKRCFRLRGKLDRALSTLPIGGPVGLSGPMSKTRQNGAVEGGAVENPKRALSKTRHQCYFASYVAVVEDSTTNFR